MNRDIFFEGEYKHWHSHLQETIVNELGKDWIDEWDLANMIFLDLNKERNIASIFVSFKPKKKAEANQG